MDSQQLHSLGGGETAALPAAARAPGPDAVAASGMDKVVDKPAASAAKPANGSVAAIAEKLVASAVPGSDAYRIGSHDVLEVTVFKVPDLSKTVQVADAGTVNLPLVGEIPAVGRTAQEIERDLTQKLGAKYLQSPQVSVFVKEFNSRRITIEGAVKKPGVMPFRGSTSLLQVLAMAEGLGETSDATVVIFRLIDGKRSAARFDIDDIRDGKSEDPPIKAGDVIVAGKSAFKEAYGQFIKAVPIASVFAAVL